MSKKFLLSLSYLSLCKFFWTRTENRVIENRVMENRVKRGIFWRVTYFICSTFFNMCVVHLLKTFNSLVSLLENEILKVLWTYNRFYKSTTYVETFTQLLGNLKIVIIPESTPSSEQFYYYWYSLGNHFCIAH